MNELAQVFARLLDQYGDAIILTGFAILGMTLFMFIATIIILVWMWRN